MAIVIFGMLLVWLGICLGLTLVAARAMRRPRRAVVTALPLDIASTPRQSA